MKQYLILIVSLLNLLPVLTVQAQKPSLAWSTVGFAEPESILENPDNGQLFVTNINGSPIEDDGNGYISLLSAEGKVIKEKWIDGLGAPKGMATDNGLLYVADLQTLHIIDIQQGKRVNSIRAEQSKMLNDIAIDSNGTLYVSDLLGGGIYRLTNDQQLELWIEREKLPHPNGLYSRPEGLYIATWGIGLRDDFTTEQLGSLLLMDTNTGQYVTLKESHQIGNLDGITFIDDTLYVNDWINGNVFHVNNGKLALLFNAGKYAADISTRQNQLLVPMMFDKRIDSYEIKQ